MVFTEKPFFYRSLVRLLLFAIRRRFFALFYGGFAFVTQDAGIVLTYLENTLTLITDFLITFTSWIIRITPKKTCWS